MLTALLRVGLVPMIFGIDLNPFKMLAKAFQKAYEWQANVIYQLLRGSAADLDKGAIGLLFAANANLAVYLAYVVLGMSMIIAVLKMKGTPFLEALVVAVIVGSVAYIWVDFVSEVRNYSISFSDTIASFNPSKTVAVAGISTPPNPVVATMMFGLSFSVGFFLALSVISFDMIAVFTAAWMMVFFALRPIGPRMKKLCNLVWAVCIVGVFLGRLLVVFFIQMGIWGMKTLPAGSTQFGGAYMMIAYSLAFLSLIGAVVGCYHTVNTIDGKISAMIKNGVPFVTNKVLKAELIRRRYNQVPIPVVVQQASFGKKIAKESASDAAKAGVKVAAKAAYKAGKKAATTAAMAAI